MRDGRCRVALPPVVASQLNILAHRQAYFTSGAMIVLLQHQETFWILTPSAQGTLDCEPHRARARTIFHCQSSVTLAHASAIINVPLQLIQPMSSWVAMYVPFL